MSMVYRLELTEREIEDVLYALESAATGAAHAAIVFPGKRAASYLDDSDRYKQLHDKLRALEPVGTEGGS